MPLSGDCVGTIARSGPIEVPTRWLLAYAAALSMLDDACFDDARPGGIVAAPFLCTRFEWALQKELRSHPALGLSDDERRRGVHLVQDSRFLAPIRPGRRVESVGTIAEVRPVRAGALIRYAYVIRDIDAGADLVRTTAISIFRDVTVAGAPRAVGSGAGSEARAAPVDLTDADRLPIAVARGFAHIYTECADIWNPIHSERRVALDAGLPDVILHGTATWALAGREILAAYARQGGRLARLSARFTGNVMLPASLILRHVPWQDRAIRFDVLRGDGVQVLSDGIAEMA